MKQTFHFTTIFLCMLAVGSFGEARREPISKKQFRKGITYLGNEQTPYTGVLFSQYENGQPEYETTYDNGKLKGVTKAWHDNGQLKYEYIYKDGKRIK